MALDSRDGSNVLDYPRQSLREMPGNGEGQLAPGLPLKSQLVAGQLPSTADNVYNMWDLLANHCILGM